MKKIFVSSAIGTERIPHCINDHPFYGKAHYSWKLIRELYVNALNDIGIEPIDLKSPDSYQHDIARKVSGIDNDYIHLCVKPIELIRPLFNNTNIAICGWEFPEFSNISYNGNPINNQVSILSRMTNVWCWSSFTASHLSSYSVSTTHLPPPVAHYISSGYESIDSTPSVILNTSSTERHNAAPLSQRLEGSTKDSTFITVLNPFDRRKNVKSLVEGFVAAHKRNNELTLLVKLVIDNVGTTVRNINDILSINYGIEKFCDNIIFIGEELSHFQMNSLYKKGEYYLCASSAEGLNLPLIEAMHNGLLAISSNATAMVDYITENNSIVLPVRRQRTGEGFHALSGLLDTTHFPPSKSGIATAVEKACRMPEKERKRISNRGKSCVDKMYGLEMFRSRISQYGIDL